MDDGIHYFVFILIICCAFMFGRNIQATQCHNVLQDGRRYVVITEKSTYKYYILGEEISKPTKVRTITIKKEGK